MFLPFNEFQRKLFDAMPHHLLVSLGTIEDAPLFLEHLEKFFNDNDFTCNQCAKLQEEINELENSECERCEKLENKIDDLEDTNDNLEREVYDLESDIESKDDMIKELQEQFSVLFSLHELETLAPVPHPCQPSTKEWAAAFAKAKTVFKRNE
jgi:uncharacterized protein Yka (UPF0111/DUF47 family)